MARSSVNGRVVSQWQGRQSVALIGTLRRVGIGIGTRPEKHLAIMAPIARPQKHLAIVHPDANPYSNPTPYTDPEGSANT